MRVFLYGKYAGLLPDGYADVHAETAAEAIEAITSQLREFRTGPRHTIVAVGFESEEALKAKTDVTEIHLVPAFFGGTAVLRIVVGVILIAVAWWNPAGWMSAAMVTGMGAMGASLVLGGLIELMAPRRTTSASSGGSDPAASAYLGAPKNTVKIGTPIPIFYGEAMIAGQYLSFNITTTDVFPKHTDGTTDYPAGQGWQTPTVPVVTV